MPVNRDHTSPSPPLITLFQEAAEQHPHKTAVVQGQIRLSYQELLALIETVARDLRGMGVVPGRLVALRFPNSIAYIVLTYAVWKCGGAILPIAVELTDEEVALICDRIRPHFFISDRKRDGAAPMTCPRIQATYYLDERETGEDLPPSIPDMAFIRFTSGTTGAFKGVALGHRTIVDRITALNHTLCIGAEDTVVWVLSMAHHFVSTIVLYLSRGASVVLTGGVPAERLLNAAKSEMATILYAAPFHYALLAADPSPERMPSLRMAISTTIALPESVFTHFQHRFGLPILQAYGIIETGLVCINTAMPVQKKNSVGRVVTGYEIEVRNLFHPLEKEPPCGRLFVRGPGFFDAYFSPFRKADDILEGGWFDTGDIGRVDSDGFVYILGRHKDLINVAGMKVFPQEVEKVLDEHPGVRESHVYGMDGDRQGEVVAAEVVLTTADSLPTERDLRNYCRGRLATYKVPEAIRFVDHIEKTAVTSKIIRHRKATSRNRKTEEIGHDD